VRALAILVLLGACMVTRAPRLDERPRWRVAGASELSGGCALARAYVRKSGKSGFGVALQLRSTSDCTFVVTRARLAFPGGPSIDVAPIEPVVLPGRSLVYAWLPVRFDNDAMWNAGRDAATLELETSSGPWRIAVEQK